MVGIASKRVVKGEIDQNDGIGDNDGIGEAHPHRGSGVGGRDTDIDLEEAGSNQL